MSCPFCYNYFTDPDFKTPNIVIDPEFASRIINTGFKRNNTFNNFDTVIFHGGEPLLYPKEILQIMKNCPGKRFSIQTNLNYRELDKEQVEVLCKIGSYGTSFSWDRFESNKPALVNMVRNIKYLSSFGLKNTLIVTLTENHIKSMNVFHLKDFIEREIQHVDYILFERPIVSIDDINNNPDKYIEMYELVDMYLYKLYTVFKDSDIKTNLREQVETAVNGGTFALQNCSSFTLTIYPNKKIKYGCPSKESKKIKMTEEFFQNCIQCKYFKFCKGDCECFNGVCAFPKQYFDRVYFDIKNGE